MILVYAPYLVLIFILLLLSIIACGALTARLIQHSHLRRCDISHMNGLARQIVELELIIHGSNYHKVEAFERPLPLTKPPERVTVFEAPDYVALRAKIDNYKPLKPSKYDS